VTYAQAKGTENQKTHKQAAQDQRGTEKQPLVIQGIPAPKTEAEAREERENRARQSEIGSSVKDSLNGLEDESVKTTHLTRWLVAVAAIQALLFVIQLGMIWSSLKDAKKASDAAKESADTAARSVMPVLFPYIRQMTELHPFAATGTDVRHEAKLLVALDNYGKMAAIVREFRANLFLTAQEGLPRNINFDNLTKHSAPAVVPGEERGRETLTGAIDVRQVNVLTPEEQREVLADGGQPKYRRYALIGRIIYDDFLGQRHKLRFCIKMRLWGDAQRPRVFQMSIGGAAYNRVETEKVPKHDPLEETIEEATPA